MAIIQSILDTIDNGVETYAQNVFNDFGGPIATTLQLMGLVSLAFVALNTMTQWVAIRPTDYIKWGVRYVVVVSVATTWAQFQPIYEILTNTPGAIGAALVGELGAPDLNTALDEMITSIFRYSEQANENSGWLSIGLASIVLWFMGALMAMVAIWVSAVAKIGLAVAVSLAPVFIGTLLFRATSDLFNTWAKWTIAFAMIPMVLAGIMAAILGVAQFILTNTPEQASTLGELAAFLIICLAAIKLMYDVPTLVQGLAGTVVATASPSDINRAAGVMMSTAKMMSAAMGRLALAARTQGDAIRSGVEGAATAGDGQSRMGAFGQGYAQERARQTAYARKVMEGHTDRSVAAGRYPTAGEQRQAYRAGLERSMDNYYKDRATTSASKPRQMPTSDNPRPDFDAAAFRQQQQEAWARKKKDEDNK